MGREIRRVPVGWVHPKREKYNSRKGCYEEDYQPLFNRDFEAAMQGWLDELAKWKEGEFARVRKDYPDDKYKVDEPYRAFCEWHGTAPDPEYYRPRWPEGAATALQMYETVSEGTPVSPVFETPEGLIDYLVANGDFWDQDRGTGGWTRENAESFVGRGWAPSLMVMNHGDGRVEIKEARDGLLATK